MTSRQITRAPARPVTEEYIEGVRRLARRPQGGEAGRG